MIGGKYFLKLLIYFNIHPMCLYVINSWEIFMWTALLGTHLSHNKEKHEKG